MPTNAYAKRPASALGIGLTILFIGAAVVFLWLNLRHARENLLSEDAVIGANIVNVAATFLIRVVFVRTGIDDALPLRLTSYAALAIALGCALALATFDR